MTPPPVLTPREREVVAALVRGATYREIALALGITRRTVRAHVRAVATRIEGSDPPVRRVLRCAHLWAEARAV